MDMKKRKKMRMFLQKDTDSRKRKKISSLKSLGGRDGNCEDEESWTGCSGFKRRLDQVRHTTHFNTSLTIMC